MSINDITHTLRERYAQAARTGKPMCCPTSDDRGHLTTFIPEEVLTIAYGCGTPAGLKTVRASETVLDIGSGGRIDCCEAARLVGPTGHVIGLDMTDTMLDIARTHAPVVAANLGYSSSNVEFLKGMADAMPVEDDSIDLIISNCVINLATDKRTVFHDMFRVAKPGGRFTISDIFSDQTVPHSLVQDTKKWGDCVSGTVTLTAYLAGLRDAGFLGVHLIQCSPWQVLDGIHFFSVTLTGYKLPPSIPTSSFRYATPRGPFRRIIDKRGIAYQRGILQPITPEHAALLATPALAAHFLLMTDPTTIDQVDSRWIAVLPAQAPCTWHGHVALLAGPFREVEDDDDHVYRHGEPVEICATTRTVLLSAPYAPYFVMLNRAMPPVTGSAVVCEPNGGCC